MNFEDFLRQAASDIVTILENIPPSTVQSLQAGNEVSNALLYLATILNRVEDLPHPNVAQP